MFEKKHLAWKICRYSVVGLTYLQKQNSWQSQWLIFAATNKRITAFSVCYCNYQSIAKQHHCDKRKISQNCYSCTKLKSDTIQNVMFFSFPIFTEHKYQRILWQHPMNPFKCRGLKYSILQNYYRTQNLKLKFWASPENSGHITTLIYCVDYRNGPRYCCQRSIVWGIEDQTGVTRKLVTRKIHA